MDWNPSRHLEHSWRDHAATNSPKRFSEISCMHACICDICKEMVRDARSNTTKMRSKKVEEIGNHLNHALISIASEVNSATQQLLKSGHSIPDLQVFIPVFVTGANLLVYDVSDELGNDSKLDIEATGTPTSWCIYQFPIRKHQVLPEIPDFINPFKKLNIFIVNVRFVTSFFEKLRSVHLIPK